MIFAEGATGTVSVAQSKNSGFLRRSTSRPYTFAYSNGTPVFVWGNTGYALLDTALHGDTAGWRKFVDQTQAHGMNKIRLLVTLWRFGVNYAGGDRAPWENCTRRNPQFAAFDQSYWESLDEIVDYMKSKAMVAELILFPDYSNPSEEEPGLYNMTQADEQRYMRFAVARYAAYSNVVWCLTNEWGNSWRGRFPSDNPPPGNNEYAGNCLSHPEWISGGGTENGLGPYMKQTDPYISMSGRLLSNHQKGTEAVNGSFTLNYVFDFWNNDWATHGIIQMANYDPGRTQGHDWGNYGIIQNWGYNAPVFNDEYGYEGATNITRELARKAAWGIALAGGYGTYAEWHGTFPDVGSMIGLWRDYPSQDDIAILTAFMRGIDYRNMSQHNELITGASSPAYMYANPGYEYIMYAADGGWNSDYTVTLEAGSYTAAWYSSTRGTVIKNEAPFALSARENKTLTAPDFSTDTDVILKIKKSSAPVVATSAASRKSHGAAGNFDINLPLSGVPGIESRPGIGPNAADHQIIIDFPTAVTCTSVAITSGVGVASSWTGNGSTRISVSLTNVADRQTIALTLRNVSNGTSTNDVTVPVSFLAGDVTGNGVVNSSDVSQARLQSGSATTASNARGDVVTNGVINSTDLSFVKSRSGTALN